jgi:aminodeoxyfutalosine synthase
MGTIEEVSVIEAQVLAGTRLDEGVLQQVATLDVLTLGMLADQARRRLHAGEATYVRVYESDITKGWTAPAIPEAAGEVRLRGLGETLQDTVAAVRAAREAAGDRFLSGFSLADLDDRSREGWVALPVMLKALADAGLEAVAEAPMDRLDATGTWIGPVRDAGLSLPRVTVDGVLGPDRVAMLVAIRTLQDAGAGFRAMAPLPRILSVASPTTGYDDVRAVALARLALENVPTIQVDWQQYGPKLAQVALTFGADDIDGIAADEDPARGWRRAPVEEARRNIVAAGLAAIERDGRFVKVGE